MYKIASRNLQRAHRVSAPLPTGGIMGDHSVVEADFIPSAANMDLEQCRAELRQLGVELVRAQNDLAVAKRRDSAAEISLLGYRVQTLVQRRSVFKTRIQSLRENDPDANRILADAIAEIAPPEVAKAIFKRARELNKEKYGA